MVEWKKSNIEEVCLEIIDCVNRTAPTVDYPTAYKMIRTTNVKNGWIDTENVRYVNEEIYARWSRRGELKRGDVILTREAPLGEVGIIRHNDTIFMGQRLMMYRADPTKLDAFFLLYAMQEQYLQGQIRAYGSGSTVEHMRVPDAKKLDIYLPPLETQRRIAAILSAYDDLIENNTQRIKALEQAAHDLYREWFVEFRFPRHESIEMVDSGTDYGMIPRGWEVGRLKDLTLNITSGGTPRTTTDEYWNGGIPWLSSGETRNPLIISTEKTITELGVKESSTRCVDKFATVIASAGQGKTRGQTSLLMIDTYINQSVLAIICDPEVATPLYIFLGLSGRYDELRSISDAASSRGSLTKQILNELPFLKPTKPSLDKFDEMAIPVYEQIYNLMKRNNALREARDLLLPRLVSGQLDVSDVEIIEGDL